MAPMMGATTGIQASPQRESPYWARAESSAGSAAPNRLWGFRPGTVEPPRGVTPPPDDQADDDGGGSQPLRSPWPLQTAEGSQDQHRGAKELIDKIIDRRFRGISDAEGARNRRRLIGYAVVREVADVDDQLRQNIRQNLAPWEDADDGLPQSHGRIGVGSGYPTGHEHGKHDSEAISHAMAIVSQPEWRPLAPSRSTSATAPLPTHSAANLVMSESSTRFFTPTGHTWAKAWASFNKTCGDTSPRSAHDLH